MELYWIFIMCLLYFISVCAIVIACLIIQRRLQRLDEQMDQAEHEMGMAVGFSPVDVRRNEENKL